MHTLYYSAGAASFVVHWLLIELGIEHRLEPVDFESRQQKSPEYLKLNPAGVVPTLVVDGVAYTEAAAIVMQLADTHPEARLAPPLGSEERARYYQWMNFFSNMLQPQFRTWWYPHEPAGEANAELAKASAAQRAAQCFDILDAHLAAHGPWLLGERLSAADFQLTMLMRWSRRMPRPATDWPALARHAQAMKARPSFKTLYEREGLTEWA
jgi:glutathione S-transferase